MAETSTGGCVRRALRSSASTRPCASAKPAISAAKGVASRNTRSSASATGINATAHSRWAILADFLRRPIVAGLAATFLDQADAFDTHAAFDRFHHIVDREAGDGHSRQ